MEDISGLPALVTEFAAAAAVTVVPAVPEHDLGPEVAMGPGDVDLPGFLALAGSLGGGAVYLRSDRFNPDGGTALSEGERLLAEQHAGQVCQVSVAFAAGGIVHFWECHPPWYLEWMALADPGAGGPAEEELRQLVGDLAGSLLENPEFRAARPVARQRIARMAIPAETSPGAIWDAVREACDRAEEMASAQYALISDRLDQLAVEVLTFAGYQQARPPGARKLAAAQFLTARADGFSPPPHVRDELYARAQRLVRTGRDSVPLF